MVPCASSPGCCEARGIIGRPLEVRPHAVDRAERARSSSSEQVRA